MSALAALAAEASGCTTCRLAQTRTQVVFGVGNPNADLMFVGEAPGADEDIQGVPFIGRDQEQVLPLQSKARIAEAILDRVEQLVRASAATPTRA